MAKTKEQKQKIIDDLKEQIEKQKLAVFINFSGVNSKTIFDLRDKLKEQGCVLKIVKKTLFQKALGALQLKELKEKIDGIKTQLALAFGFKDEITPCKIVFQSSQQNEKIAVLGGIIKNEKYEFVPLEQVIEIAKLLSRQELLAKLVGSLQSPVSRFVYVLQGNIKGLLNVLAKAKT